MQCWLTGTGYSALRRNQKEFDVITIYYVAFHEKYVVWKTSQDDIPGKKDKMLTSLTEVFYRR
jgi:hypothetical protein